jgi:hypothetical protein
MKTTPMLLIICFTWRNSMVSGYPERNFGGNQLLDSSMSLSPLYPGLTSDLHVSIAFERPPRFPLASFGPGKARYLSGPSKCAQLQIPVTYDQDRALLQPPTISGRRFTGFTFIAPCLVCHQ